MTAPARQPVQSDLLSVFAPASSLTQKEVPRLALSLEALDKSGKSHWAFHTTPDPIIVVTNDTGTAHVLNKAVRAGRKVAGVLELTYPDPDPTVTAAKDVDKEDLTVWRKEWARMKNAMQKLTQDKTVRTVIWDTATDLWQLCMLSHFGKTRAIPQHLRTECNADYSGVFWSLYKGRPELNMVLIHRLKKEYKPNSKGESDWTGKYEREGFNKIGFAVDLSLRAGWDGTMKSFYTEVAQEQATRYGTELSGQRWYGEESGFSELAVKIFPDTIYTPELWGIR